MGHQRWLAAVLAPALALAWLPQPAQARMPEQAAQAARDTQAAQADARAAARGQTEQTDQANRDAAVPDEASSAATGAQPTRAGATAPAADEGARPSGTQAAQSYGPVLYVNGKPVADAAHHAATADQADAAHHDATADQADAAHRAATADQADSARRDPAEVHDEADTGANPATPAANPAETAAASQSEQSRPQQQQQQQQQRGKQAAPRHPAWQAESEPMAPRSLHGEQGRASPGVTMPPPAAAPQPVVPSSNVINGCQGSLCTDASGKTYNGIGIGNGNAGVNSNGRLCTRTGVTVQCF